MPLEKLVPFSTILVGLGQNVKDEVMVVVENLAMKILGAIFLKNLYVFDIAM